jgi:Cu2+-exporting ATPase
VRVDAIEQPMCCPGCQAVAQAIVDSGLTTYYSSRQQLPEGVAAPLPEALSLYDSPELAARFTNDAGDAQAMLSIEGIRCSACVWLIEKRLSQVPGLKSANLNVATEKLQVTWDAALSKPSDIIRAVREVGYVAYPFDPIQHGDLLRKNARTMFKRLFVAGLSMMQVMMYAVPVYWADAGSIDSDLEQLMRWASLLLTLPAVMYSAQPFFRGAWTDIKVRTPGMDVPVALGIAAAFIGSTWSTINGGGDVYFDSVTMFIFLLLASRYVELVARRRAAASLEKLQYALPESAHLMLGFPAIRNTTIVAASTLRSGDIILSKPGEAIPVDSLIIDGETTIDLSLLTGESHPQPRRLGESVASGAVNISQPVILRVEKVARDSTLAALIRLIEIAGQGKPTIAQWADRVAAWFVGALLVFALVVLAIWSWHDATRAWPIAIAVLVVSCPCALSLATPSALAAVTDRLLRQGVLVIQPHVIETLYRATHVVLDKTGTLTEGSPQLRQTTILGEASREQVLHIAAALESGSAHPLSRALVEAAEQRSATNVNVETITHYVGQGLEGMIAGELYRIGSHAFVSALSGVGVAANEPNDMTCIYLGKASVWLARFDVSDALKPDAQAVITYFQSLGKQVILLSGDAPGIVRRMADTLGIDDAHGGILPQQKLEFVQQLQSQGARVVMVGDGMNDAAVLRAADVSFAMGSGAALAQSHADAVLLSAKLSSLIDAAEAAAACMTVIRQNLAWATLYNLVAIPAAAFGLLAPWMAGLGMSVSSSVVVINALRLERLPSHSPRHSHYLLKAH